MTGQLNQAWRRAVEALRPPRIEPFSAWIERTVRVWVEQTHKCGAKKQ
jgi:hypothetical protein